MSEEHKAIIRRYYEDLWNKWDLSVSDKLIAADIIFRGSLGVAVHGRDAFKQYVNTVQTAFPDFHNTIEDLIAESDKVVARLTYRGTHKGSLFGISPTEKTVIYEGIAIFRIANGKIVDAWILGNVLGLMQQLGILPSLQDRQR